jgi:putative flippase GtrA
MLRALCFTDLGQAAVALRNFLLTGCVGLATDASVFTIVDGVLNAPWLSRLVSLGVATIVTWQINRHVSFRAVGRGRVAQMARYVLVAAAAQSVSYATFLTILALWPSVPHVLALVVGAGFAAGLGFAGHASFAFRDRIGPVAASELAP